MPMPTITYTDEANTQWEQDVTRMSGWIAGLVTEPGKEPRDVILAGTDRDADGFPVLLFRPFDPTELLPVERIRSDEFTDLLIY